MGLLSSLFGSRDPLSDLARQSDPHAFVTSLCRSDIVLLSVPFESRLDPDTMTQEEFLADIEAAARNVAQNQTGFQPFTYDKSGKRVLPFFSTQKLAETFVTSYVNRVRKIIPFQVLTVRGDALADVRDAADCFVLNAETKSSQDCTHLLGCLFEKKDET
jgi:hypothetical protein